MYIDQKFILSLVLSAAVMCLICLQFLFTSRYTGLIRIAASISIDLRIESPPSIRSGITGPSSTIAPPFLSSTSQPDLVSQLKLSPETGAYESEGKPIIWYYWNNDRMPLYVRLLIEAMHCRNPEFKIIIVHESTIYQYLPDLKVPIDIFRLLHGPHQADIFRIAILQKYGGVYIDVGVYALDKIYPLYQQLKTHDLVIGDFGHVLPGFHVNPALSAMGPTRANVSFFRVWHDNQISEVQKFIPSWNQKNLTADPMGSIDILYGTEGKLREEIESNRTTWIRYAGPNTNNQLIEKGLHLSSSLPWSSVSDRVLPLNWSPFLFVWGADMRKSFSNLTAISQLFPEEETLYSVFVGCALLECKAEYHTLQMKKKTESPVGQLNVAEALENLKRVNRTVCGSIRQELKFELNKYRITP